MKKIEGFDHKIENRGNSKTRKNHFFILNLKIICFFQIKRLKIICYIQQKKAKIETKNTQNSFKITEAEETEGCGQYGNENW